MHEYHHRWRWQLSELKQSVKLMANAFINLLSYNYIVCHMIAIYEMYVE